MVRAGQRVMVNGDPSPTRWTGALIIAGGVCWLIVLLLHHRGVPGGHTLDHPTWSLSLLGAVVLVARGDLLGRPVTIGYASVAAVMFSAGTCADLLGLQLFDGGLVAGAAMVLVWPMPSHPDPAALPRVWALIEATRGDPLAPFTMQSTKSYFFEPGGAAAFAYRARCGFAVISGDPIGQRTPDLNCW